MKRVALVFQAFKQDSVQMAEEAAVWLSDRGHETELYSAFDLSAECPAETALAIAFGGDGTTLRTARWFAGTKTPVLSVRMGTLSFLGEVDPAELFNVLPSYLDGDFWVEERAMLEGHWDGQ